METILIVENNSDFSYVIQWYFANKGYTVYAAASGEKALQLFQEHGADIILMDISLDGEMSGKDVARQIRLTNKKIPIIFMSGENNSPTDVVEALGIGGNFFLKKPVSIEEIEAHILVALQSVEASADEISFAPTTLSFRERMIKGKQIEYLTEKETDVLQVLARSPNAMVQTMDILIAAWGTDDKEESLRNCISSLRKKLKETNIQIETIKGMGYRLVVD